MDSSAIVRKVGILTRNLVVTLVLLIGLVLILGGLGAVVNEGFPYGVLAFIGCMWICIPLYIAGFRMLKSLRRTGRFESIGGLSLFRNAVAIYFVVAIPLILLGVVLRPFFTQRAEDVGVAITAAGILALVIKLAKSWWDTR